MSDPATVAAPDAPDALVDATWRDSEPAPVRSTARGRADGLEDRLPIWRRIVADLERRITEDNLTTGDRLPTEAALATHFDVNRQTVRLAIADLARRGMVRCVPREGTFVANARLTFSVERHVRFADNVLRAGREPSHRLLVTETVTAPAEVAAWLSIARRAKVVRIEAVGLANREPICLINSWFPADRFPRIGDYVAKYGDVAKSLAKYSISSFERKFSRITARTATDHERHMLGLDHAAAIMMLEALFVDAHGEPIEIVHATYRSDRVEIVVPVPQKESGDG